MHANNKNTFRDNSSSQVIHYLDLGIKDFSSVLMLQNRLFNDLLKNYKDSTENYIIFCEHKPVYTIGKSGDINNLLKKEDNIEVFPLKRGGDITFHGPGQLVGYPIINLSKFKIGLKNYVELLELSIVDVLNEYGILAGRSETETGVWLNTKEAKSRKICAIGIRSSRYITMHGFALNVNTDLTYFNNINPCGIRDKEVTSIQRETGIQIPMKEIKEKVLKSILKRLSAGFKVTYDNFAQ